MVGRSLVATAALAILAAGCGKAFATSSSPGLTPAPRSLALSTPTLAQQVVRAREAGPGFLDYCPTHSGVNPARFQLDVPGGTVAPGWCATIAVRRARRDLVTFGAHWNGQKAIHRSGTWHITYALSRTITLTSTPEPRLLSQGGTTPP